MREVNTAGRDGIWAIGTAYEPYVGRWSRLVAREFLNWLGAPKGQTWLDVGCGTGALWQTILSVTAPRYVVGVDASAGYAEYARQQVRVANACFEVRDARALLFGDASYDAAVSGLVLNFVPEPARAAAEMARVFRRGGQVAAYVWDMIPFI
jgi:ubiquinone/menaquinone biosynthesis C-methylase UbiE